MIFQKLVGEPEKRQNLDGICMALAPRLSGGTRHYIMHYVSLFERYCTLKYIYFRHANMLSDVSSHRISRHQIATQYTGVGLEGELPMIDENNKNQPYVLLWTIPQVGKALNLGKTKIYELIWKEALPVKKFGRAVRVCPLELKRWL